MNQTTSNTDDLSADLVALLLAEAEPTPIEVLRSQLAFIEPRADFDYALFLALAAGSVEETEPGIMRLR